MSYRIGQGYDVHQLDNNLPLILGGIKIPHHKGIVAHSDGDILAHAIIDAILGACNLGDIGLLFPNDDQCKDMSGLAMLTKIKEYLQNNQPNFFIVNIDTTIILQTPKLSAYIDRIKKNIAHSLDINLSLISIKATTTDYLGFIGKEQGIACLATCLINQGKLK